MNPRRTTSPILLLIVLACVGLMLVNLPPILLGQYRAAAELGPVWGNVYLASLWTGLVLLGGCVGWMAFRLWRASRRKRQRRQSHEKSPSELTHTEIEREIRENLSAVEDFHADKSVDDDVRQELKPLAGRLEDKRESQTLEIVAFGTVSGGKSSLLNALAGRDVFATDAKGGTTTERNDVPWPGRDRVVLVDTPGLGEVDGAQRASRSADAAQNADLVLLVVDGPLRDREFALLEHLARMEKRVLICLNKEDWYTESDRDRLLTQIREQVEDAVASEDVVAVRSRPTQRTRRRVLPEGSETQETVEVAADITPLASRMLKIVAKDGTDLLLANLLLQSRGLIEEARRKAQASLDRRAWEIVDRYALGAGSVAALSPFPLVDLAAGCAISSKMVVDLARAYRQDIDVEVAMNLLGQMGKNLLAVLGMSVATPLVASVIASLIKTVPGVGTIAGGVLQGIVLALVTRWVGAVFIEYFKNEMQEPEGGLTGLARRQWQRVTSAAELRKLVQAAAGHLRDRGES